MALHRQGGDLRYSLRVLMSTFLHKRIVQQDYEITERASGCGPRLLPLKPAHELRFG